MPPVNRQEQPHEAILQSISELTYIKSWQGVEFGFGGSGFRSKKPGFRPTHDGLAACHSHRDVVCACAGAADRI